MDFIDYYKILGIAKNATPKEIKSAYRKLARKFHPDLNPNDKNAKINFQQINEANEVLSDPEKRSKYDQHGLNWKHADEAQDSGQKYRQSAGPQHAGRAAFSDESDFSDFFESLFSGQQSSGSRRQAKFRGTDYNVELRMELADAVKTHKQTISVNGKKLRINIPAGVENGQTIKIGNHGGPGINGGPNGDLFISFSIANHPAFKRLGVNLYTTVDLDLFTAILGGEMIIDTLNGKVKLLVPPETQNGSRVKLKGKGFPYYKKEGQYGDLIITYMIKIPSQLTEKQKSLFTELSKL